MTRRNAYRVPINPYDRRNRGGDPDEERAIAEALGAYHSVRPECPMCLGTGHVARSLTDDLTEEIRVKAEAVAASYAYPTRSRLVAATLLVSGSTKAAAAQLGITRQRILQIINS